MTMLAVVQFLAWWFWLAWGCWLFFYGITGGRERAE